MNPKYAINAMKMLCIDNEMKIIGSVVSLGKEPRAAAKNKPLGKKCKELGRKLARV